MSLSLLAEEQHLDVAIHVLAFLDLPDLLTVSGVCKGFHSFARQDVLWRRLCMRHWAIRAPIKPRVLSGDGEFFDTARQTWALPTASADWRAHEDDPARCLTYYDAFKAWWIHTHGSELVSSLAQSAGIDPLLLSRSIHAWNTCAQWLSEHTPMIQESLEAPIPSDALRAYEEELGVALPPAAKAFWSVHDGQVLDYDHVEEDTDEVHPSILQGLFGSCCFYDAVISVRLCSLASSQKWTTDLRTAGLLPKDCVVIAHNLQVSRLYILDCKTGQVSVSLRERDPATRFIRRVPCCPESPDGDGILRWFETYVALLHNGYFGVMRRYSDFSTPIPPVIRVYPERGPFHSVAVTRGVEVSAAVVYIPERSQFNHPFFTYNIRMRMLPAEESEDAAALQSCQLYSRFWRIVDSTGHAEEVQGEAVIGKYPYLEAGGEAFEYQSCTGINTGEGYMEGHFMFFEGRLDNPRSEDPFQVDVPRFLLKVPAYYY